MNRITLTDGSGWFNRETAIHFTEATWFDGRNQISRATGSQWHHQSLYYTKSGKWVMHCWSNYQNEPDAYETVSQDEAITWLIAMGGIDTYFGHLDDLPKDVRLAFEEEDKLAEI